MTVNATWPATFTLQEGEELALEPLAQAVVNDDHPGDENWRPRALREFALTRVDLTRLARWESEPGGAPVLTADIARDAVDASDEELMSLGSIVAPEGMPWQSSRGPMSVALGALVFVIARLLHERARVNPSWVVLGGPQRMILLPPMLDDDA